MKWKFPFSIVAGAVQRIVLPIRYVLQAAGLAGTEVLPTFGAAITIDNALGDQQTIVQTSNAAHTLAAPTSNGVAGQWLTIIFRNTSGGAAGVATFNAAYHNQAAWTQPATGNQRAITYRGNGAGVWHEVWRNTADVAN